MKFIVRKCPLTQGVSSMQLDVTQEQLDAWRGGKCAQDAFPQLSAEEREFIMTGIRPETWARLIGEEA